MTNTITYEGAEAMTRALNLLFSRNDGVMLDVKNTRGTGKYEIEVNWSAIGSVSPERALEFAGWLAKASRVAQYINNQGFVVDMSTAKDFYADEWTEDHKKSFKDLQQYYFTKFNEIIEIL